VTSYIEAYQKFAKTCHQAITEIPPLTSSDLDEHFSAVVRFEREMVGFWVIASDDLRDAVQEFFTILVSSDADGGAVKDKGGSMKVLADLTNKMRDALYLLEGKQHDQL